MHNIKLLYTTISNIAAAENLAQKVIENKLAACANIIPGGVSIYEWEGKICKEPECYILFKTSTDKLEELKDFIIKNHPYSIPAILTSHINTSLDFLHYIHQKTTT